MGGRDHSETSFDEFEQALNEIRCHYANGAEIETELRFAKEWAESVDVDRDEDLPDIGFKRNGSTFWYLGNDCCWDADDPRSEMIESLIAERDRLAAECERLKGELAEERAKTLDIDGWRESVDEAMAQVDRLTKERDHALQLAAERYEEAEECHAALGEPTLTARPTIAALRAECTRMRAVFEAAKMWREDKRGGSWLVGSDADLAAAIDHALAQQDGEK